MNERIGGGSAIRVLHVGSEHARIDVATECLEQAGRNIDVVGITDPTTVLDRLGATSFDCIISEYEMLEMTGLSVFAKVRSEYPEVPFFLLTEHGQTEIVREAFAHGVTDCVEMKNGAEQYRVLANRIENAVVESRNHRVRTHRSTWFEEVLTLTADSVMIVDTEGQVRYVSPTIEREIGVTPNELLETHVCDVVYEPDQSRVMESLRSGIEASDATLRIEFRLVDGDGTIRWFEARGQNYCADTLIAGLLLSIRDITDRKQREEAIERQHDHLQELTRFLTHDIRNQLVVMEGYATLAQSNDEITEIAARIDRIGEMVDTARELARSGQNLAEVETVRFGDILQECWRVAPTTETNATLTLDTDLSLLADRERLQTLLENLIANAIEHGGPDVTVRAGSLDSKGGFYVEDTGTGIASADFDQIFNAGFTTSTNGTGLGLVIVDRIAHAHDWHIVVTESANGGARFEFIGIDGVDRQDHAAEDVSA